MHLKDKVVLITGGAVRIGRAITVELITAGANVFCHYFSSEREARELKNEYPSVNLLKGNLKQISTVAPLIHEIVEVAGTIDVLINNAAIFMKTPFGTVTEENWDNLFALNLKPNFFLSQEASKIMMEKQTGKIVNIADTSGLRPWPSYIPYSLTKSGMISLTKGLAKALAPHVQVNCINPGPVLMPDNYSDEQIAQAIEKTLLKRAGQAEDVASAVRFLLEDGDYITGLILSVDGGRSIK
ncbi:MAG: SDR family oxidoreductase [Calditrichia bacterium]|nr:SDR family oxidoreductase [Calditrichia bacterium]